MLAFATAKRAVELGRNSFFPEHAADLPVGRSDLLRGDDLAPQFGYIGPRYLSARVLLMGINPGNGPQNSIRTPGDARMMPALIRFAQSPTEDNFAKASEAYMSECQNWPVWKRHCAEVMGAGKLEFDEIAYANCLPWRTESKSRFSDFVAQKSAELYVRPLVEELKPVVIVAMGKRAAEILGLSGVSSPKPIVWNRAQAATHSVRLERTATAKKILGAVNRK